MSILGCAGSEEEGSNFNPPTLGEFMKAQKISKLHVLRESRAGASVIKEAREFHEKQALKHGINTRRGLAHMRASRLFSREAGTGLQEKFENGGDQLGELPPKAVIKANKAAMMFHKKQAEKHGLDSDLGHAHTAAMEHHMDVMKKAKDQQKQKPQQGQPQQQPMQASKEALPGKSGKQAPMPVPQKSDMPNQDVRMPLPPVPLSKLQQGKDCGMMASKEAGVKGMKWGVRNKRAAKGGVTSGHLASIKRLADQRTKGAETAKKKLAKEKDPDERENHKEDLQMYKGDAKDFNTLHNALASGDFKGAARLLYDKMDSEPRDSVPSSVHNAVAKGIKTYHPQYYKDRFDDDSEESNREAIRRIDHFGEDAMGRIGKARNPSKINHQLDDDKIFRGKYPDHKKWKDNTGLTTKEARRRLHRSIWESDDSERDRSASGLTA